MTGERVTIDLGVIETEADGATFTTPADSRTAEIAQNCTFDGPYVMALLKAICKDTPNNERQEAYFVVLGAIRNEIPHLINVITKLESEKDHLQSKMSELVQKIQKAAACAVVQTQECEDVAKDALGYEPLVDEAWRAVVEQNMQRKAA